MIKYHYICADCKPFEKFGTTRLSKRCMVCGDEKDNMKGWSEDYDD